MSDETHRPEVSFAAFVISLASNAAVHFGDLPDPVTNETKPANLDAASHVIDLLAMLQEKTKGNLSAEERQLLDGLLYELRLRFVQARNIAAPAPQP